MVELHDSNDKSHSFLFENLKFTMWCITENDNFNTKYWIPNSNSSSIYICNLELHGPNNKGNQVLKNAVLVISKSMCLKSDFKSSDIYHSNHVDLFIKSIL